MKKISKRAKTIKHFQNISKSQLNTKKQIVFRENILGRNKRSQNNV